MKKLVIAIATLAGVIAVVVVARTLMHTPTGMSAVERITVRVDEATIARHLAEAVRIRTISHQHREEFEAGEFEKFVSWAEVTYPEVHQAMELSRHGNYTLLYRWPGSDTDLQPILLTAHYDVVPVIPGSEANWQHPPFEGVIDDGIIWGRGALDDKSAVIAQLEAATHLLRQGFQPQRTIYFSFGHDEELGGPRGAAAVTSYLAAEGVQLAWSLDEGSFLFQGLIPGVAPLMAAINVAEKGSVTLQVVASSAGGHSSMPPKQTAVGLLAGAITDLENDPVPGGLSGLSARMFDRISRHMPFGSRMLFANQWLFGSILEDRLSDVNFSNAMLRTTTAPTMLAGSVKVNVLPIEAIATVNFRVHPRDTPESVVAHVRSVVERDNVEVRVPAGSGRPASAVSSWEAPGYRIIEQAVREVYGETVVTPGLMIAGSDTRHYGKVADNAYRFNPMVLSQEDLTGFHGTNEKISVKNLAQGVRTYVRILVLGGKKGSG